MKRTLPGLLILISAMVGLASIPQSSQPLPVPFPEVRYQQMSAKSPFAVASANAAATAAPTPGFAAQLYVNGVSRIAKSEYVAIKSRDPDKPTAMFIEVGGTSNDGMKVERVHWSDELGKSTVDVSLGNEKATLIFDEAQMAKNAAPVPVTVPGQPGVRLPTMPGQGRPVGFPMQNRFQQPGQPIPPSGPRVFPQPGMQPGVQPGNPPMPNGIQTRRRRVIPSGP